MAERLHWFDRLRISAVFAVVVLHVSARAIMEIPDHGNWQWWTANIISASVRWCVPVFVMISGALMLNPVKDEPAGAFLKKRLARIGAPFIFWSLFYIAFTIALGEPANPLQIIKKLVLGQTYYHMWYLNVIIGLYLITPFLRIALKEMKRRQVLVLSIALLAVGALTEAVSTFVFGRSAGALLGFSGYAGYYVFGRYAAWDADKTVSATRSAISVLLLSILFASFGAYAFSIKYGGVPAKWLYFYGYLSLPAIFTSIGAFIFFRGKFMDSGSNETLQRVSDLSLGIYLSHPFFLRILSLNGISSVTINPIISIPLISASVFLLALGSSIILKRLPYIGKVV